MKMYRRVKSHDIEEWSKEKLILEKYAFFCDAIDLKKSVENTFKVYEKSLATVLDENHFIVNLYSFSCP